MAGVGQRADQALAQRIVIVNNENASHLPISPHFATDGTTGSVTRNVAPRPGADTASICPSCASTTLRTIARPRPVPCGLVVKNGLKIRSRSSAAMPGPLSRTSTTTRGGCGSPVPTGSSSPGSATRISTWPAAQRLERVRQQVREQLPELVRVRQELGHVRRESVSIETAPRRILPSASVIESLITSSSDARSTCSWIGRTNSSTSTTMALAILASLMMSLSVSSASGCR